MILSVARHLWRRWHAMLAARAATLPVNLRKIEVSSETISADVEYAVRIGEEYVTLVRGISDDIRERSVLELGPGINFGSSLVLACHGARVLVADRFLAPWQDPYHPSFYRALNAWLADNRLSLDRTH